MLNWIGFQKEHEAARVKVGVAICGCERHAPYAPGWYVSGPGANGASQLQWPNEPSDAELPMPKCALTHDVPLRVPHWNMGDCGVVDDSAVTL